MAVAPAAVPSSHPDPNFRNLNFSEKDETICWRAPDKLPSPKKAATSDASVKRNCTSMLSQTKHSLYGDFIFANSLVISSRSILWDDDQRLRIWLFFVCALTDCISWNTGVKHSNLLTVFRASEASGNCWNAGREAGDDLTTAVNVIFSTVFLFLVNTTLSKLLLFCYLCRHPFDLIMLMICSLWILQPGSSASTDETICTYGWVQRCWRLESFL